MPLSEFDLIQQFLSIPAKRSSQVNVAIGDDAAVLSIPPENELVTSIDLLNQGVHFLENTAPYDIGYKALAVSLSDMAAMGAEPFSALLTLSLPAVDSQWMADFAKGFFALAKAHQVDLVGGDVTRGPLSVGTQVNGFVPKGQALLRSGAKVGDLIYVTGTLGDAGFALQCLQQQAQLPLELERRLSQPTPRVKAGLTLRGIASSAMDISDGLAADLKKLCQASGVGAELDSRALPLSPYLQQLSEEEAVSLALSAGDDYELLFTMPATSNVQLEIPFTCVGKITAGEGILVKDKNGKLEPLTLGGYDHFKETKK